MDIKYYEAEWSKIPSILVRTCDSSESWYHSFGNSCVIWWSLYGHEHHFNLKFGLDPGYER